ncbi:hypothetical protein GNIT_1542 [Glaciecola nitratireducens FR1064]|uniref:Uncharacterized protein n=1 Tax=Glaciecola nitratireducens (strain JCM 12485 / KCTC 12276 / FR1064) TaxID=1085623 RepID=G4QGM3_GLANF|nr:hypothetical protein GNIT_1542 [Glaciecola nitratireducens FR1064]
MIPTCNKAYFVCVPGWFVEVLANYPYAGFMTKPPLLR